MNPWIKNILGAIVTFLVIMTIIIIGSFYMLESSLPVYSGEMSVSNIDHKIEIYRDDFAIPYVNAQTELDAYFALGYLHAQERLFQMDFNRRAGEGRFSEIFGSRTLFFDKMFKTLGLYEVVKKSYANFDEETKNILIAYSNGVNEFIKNSPEKYTIEFDILGYKPEIWKPEHSLLIAKLIAWELNISWWSDIAFTHLIQKLGEEKAKDILPNFDENAPTIVPKELNKFAEISTELIKIDREFRKFAGGVGTHIGSNNWVVSGARSASGKPIIANDPHLVFTAPAKWYVVSITSPKLKVDGFTLPGVPGIVIGKNKNISWVLTNVMADDADFYIEKIDSSRTNYYLDGEWQPLEIITDTIFVKDSANVIFKISKNHRGPIISDIHTFNKLFPYEENVNADISMRWTALEFSDELIAMTKINSAENWNQFQAGLEMFKVPGQNFVYADIDGNIGYKAGVKLPIRKNNSTSFVFDGTKSESDWTGFVPFRENPKLFNPPQGYIASANNKIIENYPYHISNVWEPKSRILRITELLDSQEIHSVEDFKEYQMDFYSYFAKDLTPFILAAFSNREFNSGNLKKSIRLFESWDFKMISESQVPTIYAVFFQNLLKNIFQDEMGESLFNEYIFLANIPYRVVPKLLAENKSDWFDDISTTEIETRDKIIRKSFEEAINYLETKLGVEIEGWQWGEIHKVTFKHYFHGESKFLDELFDVGPFELSGDGTTIFNTEYIFSFPYESNLGPSMRFIYDFDKPDNFEFILPTGQSGHFYSDHYKDMTELWLSGKYISVNTNLDTIKSKGYDLLELIPVSL